MLPTITSRLERSSRGSCLFPVLVFQVDVIGVLFDIRIFGGTLISFLETFDLDRSHISKLQMPNNLASGRNIAQTQASSTLSRVQSMGLSSVSLKRLS